MYVTRHQDLSRAALPGIEHVTLACADDGARHLSVWRQSIAPGGATPPHSHDCEEVVVVESGRGELRVDGRVVAFDAGSTLTLPPGLAHQIVNTGDAPLRLTAAFSATPVGVFLPDGSPLALPWRS